MQKSIYPWQKNRNRGKMLRGVVSTSVMKNPVFDKDRKAAGLCQGIFDKSDARGKNGKIEWSEVARCS